jgi:hypothetical protein
MCWLKLLSSLLDTGYFSRDEIKTLRFLYTKNSKNPFSMYAAILHHRHIDFDLPEYDDSHLDLDFKFNGR